MPFAKVLASNVGELVSFDDSTMMGTDKALYLRVDIDITKPLQRGINVMIAGKPIWIRFKYVKLPDFCYGCGKLGHVLKGCNTIETEERDPGLQHGAWLRASPMKSWRRNGESQLQEEKKLFSIFQKTKANPPTRTKLVLITLISKIILARLPRAVVMAPPRT